MADQSPPDTAFPLLRDSHGGNVVLLLTESDNYQSMCPNERQRRLKERVLMV